MNFLAHAFLSGDNELMRIGNVTGDTIRKIHIEKLPLPMQQGVLLHRAIDHFTDHHAGVIQMKEILKPWFSRYAGVALDVFYDHFLSGYWNRFSSTEKSLFISELYLSLNRHHHHLPEKAKHFVEFMIKNDWLSAYATAEGIQSIMLRMGKRAGFETGFEKAREALEKNYSELDSSFSLFFPDLQRFSKGYIDKNFTSFPSHPS